jgi:hypothetical protein
MNVNSLSVIGQTGFSPLLSNEMDLLKRTITPFLPARPVAGRGARRVGIGRNSNLMLEFEATLKSQIFLYVLEVYMRARGISLGNIAKGSNILTN